MSTIDRLSQAFTAELDQYARYKGEKTPSLFGDDGNSSWDELKHPRVEKGSKVSHGGQFTSEHGTSENTPAKPKQIGLFQPQLLEKPKPENEKESLSLVAKDKDDFPEPSEEELASHRKKAIETGLASVKRVPHLTNGRQAEFNAMDPWLRLPDEHRKPFKDHLEYAKEVGKAWEADRSANPGQADPSKPIDATAKPGIVIPSSTVPNSDAKPGDQLGLFGDAVKAPKPLFKPQILENATKAKQGGLFDTKGNANQIDLFGGGGIPDNMTYKPDAKSEGDLTLQLRDIQAKKDKLPSEKHGPLIAKQNAIAKKLDAIRDVDAESIAKMAPGAIKRSDREVKASESGLNEAESNRKWALLLERYAGKDQMRWDFGDEHEPVGATALRRRKPPKNQEEADEMAKNGQMKVTGTNKDVLKCERCGRTHLHKTYIVETIGDNGKPMGDKHFYGSDCVSKMTGKSIESIQRSAAEAKHLQQVENSRQPAIAKYSQVDDDLFYDPNREIIARELYNAVSAAFSIDRYDNTSSSRWNEQLHSRGHKGSSNGGRFTSNGDSGRTPTESPPPGSPSNRVFGSQKQAPSPQKQATSPAMGSPMPTKVRELAAVPDTQSHHSLHIKNQPHEVNIALNDYKKSFNHLWRVAAGQAGTDWIDANAEEKIWQHVDKSKLTELLNNINAKDKSLRENGGSGLADAANYNQVIPKQFAERLHGGSRFFDPEKLRGRWNETAPPPKADPIGKLPGQQNPGNVRELTKAFSNEFANQRPPKKAASKPQNEDQPELPVQEKPGQIQPPKVNPVQDELSEQTRKMVNKAISELISTDPQTIEDFRPILISAWKQKRDEVAQHNQAFREIVGTKTPQVMSTLVRQARNNTLDPATKKNFDIMVHSAENGRFGHLLQGRGEDGLLDLLSEGIKQEPNIMDDDVAELAVGMAGPGFFADRDPGESPDDSENEHEDIYDRNKSAHLEDSPFSWQAAGALIERYFQQALTERYSCATPTPAQIRAGNYRKKHIRIQGMDLSIENEKGTRRKPEWPKLHCDYGYIKRTTGADGDHVDVFVGPSPGSEIVYIIDQLNSIGKFDEHKAMVGFTSKQQAVEAYKKCYTSSQKVGRVTAMTVGQFKTWLAKGNQNRPVAHQISRYSFDESEHYAGKDQLQFNWDESQHPRESKGSVGGKGGEFAKKILTPSKLDDKKDESVMPKGVEQSLSQIPKGVEMFEEVIAKCSDPKAGKQLLESLTELDRLDLERYLKAKPTVAHKIAKRLDRGDSWVKEFGIVPLSEEAQSARQSQLKKEEAAKAEAEKPVVPVGSDKRIRLTREGDDWKFTVPGVLGFNKSFDSASEATEHLSRIDDHEKLMQAEREKRDAETAKRQTEKRKEEEKENARLRVLKSKPIEGILIRGGQAIQVNADLKKAFSGESGKAIFNGERVEITGWGKAFEKNGKQLAYAYLKQPEVGDLLKDRKVLGKPNHEERMGNQSITLGTVLNQNDKTFVVTKVGKANYRSQDWFDDNDDFGMSPGWYTSYELTPVEWRKGDPETPVQNKERRKHAFESFVKEAKAVKTHAELPKLYSGGDDDRFLDSYPQPVKDRDDLFIHHGPYPTKPIYFRKSDKGYEELGKFEFYK